MLPNPESHRNPLIAQAVEEVRFLVPTFPEVETPWDFLEELIRIKPHDVFGERLNVASLDEDEKADVFGIDCTIQPHSLFSGLVLLSPFARVGPYCLLRGPVFLGQGVTIGSYNEVHHSVILNSTGVYHRNDVLHSIIGSNCWLSGHIACHNMRIDKTPVPVEWEGETVARSTKFGAVISNNCKLGGGVRIMPGAVIEPNSTILGPSVVTGKGKVRMSLKQKEPS